MERAIQLSLDNIQSGGGPFAAVIVRGGEIVAEGANRVTANNDPTAHAEIVAIREACQKLGMFSLQECEIFTSCEPCPMCLGAIYWARLAKIYYANTAVDAAAIGFDDSFIYGEFTRPPGLRKIPMIPILRDQALRVFHAWQQKQDKIFY